MASDNTEEFTEEEMQTMNAAIAEHKIALVKRLNDVKGPFMLVGDGGKDKDGHKVSVNVTGFVGDIHMACEMIIRLNQARESFIIETIKNLPQEEAIHFMEHVREIGTSAGVEEGEIE